MLGHQCICAIVIIILTNTIRALNGTVLWNSFTQTHIHTCTQNMYEQSTNHTSIQNRPRRYMQSHPLCRTCFSQYQASSAVLGWLGDGDCHLMHKIQSGGWSYSKAPLKQRMHAQTVKCWEKIQHKEFKLIKFPAKTAISILLWNLRIIRSAI